MITAEEARQNIYKELDKDPKFTKLIKDIDDTIRLAIIEKRFFTEFHSGRDLSHSYLQGIIKHYKDLGYSVKVLTNWEKKQNYIKIAWYEEEC